MNTLGPKLAELLAKMTAMQAEIDQLKNRKPGSTTIVNPPEKKAPPPPPAKAPAAILFASHDHVKDDTPPVGKAPLYTLAPGSTKLPCVVEMKIDSDVPGYFTCRVSVNVYDTATRKHLLVPQGSMVLAHDNSNNLMYGSERLDTVSLTLTLPDGRSVDLGKAPVTDEAGAAGLTGEIDRHFWRLFGAVLIGGALKGGMQALQIAAADAAGAGQVATGFTTLGNQATNRVIQPYINIRPTIRVFAGQIANVLLIKELRLPAMWQ